MICYRDTRYVLPARDFQPLPVDNFTAERLSEYSWGDVARGLQLHGVMNLTSMMVGVE
jgi:hypothetical protein